MNKAIINSFRNFPHISRVMIWDLDGTIINSFHRVAPCFDSEGNLDLNKYKNEACKHHLNRSIDEQVGLLFLAQTRIARAWK